MECFCYDEFGGFDQSILRLVSFCRGDIFATGGQDAPAIGKRHRLGNNQGLSYRLIAEELLKLLPDVVVPSGDRQIGGVNYKHFSARPCRAQKAAAECIDHRHASRKHQAEEIKNLWL